MDMDQNLLFGIEALQLDMISKSRLAEAWSAWDESKEHSLAGLMVDRGWISDQDRASLEETVERMMTRFDGDARKALAAVAGTPAREFMISLEDSKSDVALALTPAALSAEYVQVDTPGALSETVARYTRIRLHGEGGLGRIWIVHDGDLNREVALKELRSDHASNAEHMTRFLKEAQVTGQLEHPSIVPVYELGRRSDESHLYYTMRYVRGKTLTQRICEHHLNKPGGAESRLGLRRLLNAFVSVCNAIAYAHSRGVLHRDLKPENVVLGAFGEVIVLDWGLAKIIDQDEPEPQSEVRLTEDALGNTFAGMVMGTPAYMSPEQAAGRTESLNTLTDVYGLGAILFEILTGRPPHVGTTTAEVIRKIVSDPTPTALSVRPDVRPGLDAICSHAMEKSMDDRYQNVRDLVLDTQSWLADEPVSVYRRPFAGRVSRWTRHHQTLTGVSMIILVTTITLGVMLLWQRQNAVNTELEKLAQEVQQSTGSLMTLIGTFKEDTRYLAGQPRVRDILIEARNGTLKGARRDELCKPLEIFFESFTLHRKSYFQARLIAKNGDELVRVERNKDFPGGRMKAEPGRVRFERPPNQKGRTYFKDSMRLKRDKVYLSDIELNREDGEIEVPDMPVIRAAMPVFEFDADDARNGPDPEALGVVVINIHTDPLFTSLSDEPHSEHVLGKCLAYVLNEEGHYILNPEDATKTFGFEREQRGSDYKFQGRYPELAPNFDDANPEPEPLAICGGGERAVYLMKLHYSGDRYLWLAIATSYQELKDRASGQYALGMNLTLALIGVLILTPIVAWLWRRRDRKAPPPAQSTA